MVINDENGCHAPCLQGVHLLSVRSRRLIRRNCSSSNGGETLCDPWEESSRCQVLTLYSDVSVEAPYAQNRSSAQRGRDSRSAVGHAHRQLQRSAAPVLPRA